MFEDNAEFGLGMALASVQRRRQVQDRVKAALVASQEGDCLVSPELSAAMAAWIDDYDDADKSDAHAEMVREEWRVVHPCCSAQGTKTNLVLFFGFFTFLLITRSSICWSMKKLTNPCWKEFIHNETCCPNIPNGSLV